MMMYSIGKRGAVLSNGEVLHPGEIINIYYQSLEEDISKYEVSKSLDDYNNRKTRLVESTIKEFDFLYDSEVLVDISNIKPLTEPLFRIGSLVSVSNNRSVGVITGKKYDYETLKWMYHISKLDYIRNVHHQRAALGLYLEDSIDENRLNGVQKGEHSLQIGSNSYKVKYKIREEL